MIVFDLQCDDGHRFEGWFGSSSDYERQHQSGLIACPQCGSIVVGKAVMAPAVGRKGNQVPLPAPARPEQTAPEAPGGTAVGAVKRMPVSKPALAPEALKMMQALAKIQAKALEKSRWVGDTFAEDARAMHYGEREIEIIHGQATVKEAEQLVEEGIVVMPLPFPVLPPEQAN